MQPQTMAAGGCHDGSVTATAAIVVNDLSKAYGAHEAVRGLTSRSAAARSSACSGPTGRARRRPSRSSRATASATAARSPCSATTPAERAAELRSRVGIVLQSCGTYPHLTVRETLEHWARLYPAPRGVDETIALAGLEAAADRRARTLSGGQLRRLDLALALVGDPELIFLDEPTTGFDPAARRAAWQVVRALRDLGKTVLLTTHYLDEAQALADRVAIVKDGRILAEGPPGELIAGAARYRVSYRARRRAGRARDRRPDDAAARGDRRRARPRRAARGALREPPEPRGRLPRADGGGAGAGARRRMMALAWRQFRLERRMFWRNPTAAFFNFLLPLLLLALFGAVFAGQQRGPRRDRARDRRA